MYTVFVLTNNINQRSYVSFSAKASHIYLRDLTVLARRPQHYTDSLFMLDLKQLGMDMFTVHVEEGIESRDEAMRRRNALIHKFDASTHGYNQRRKQYERTDVPLHFLLMFCDRQTGDVLFHVTKQTRKTISDIRQRHTQIDELKPLNKVPSTMLGIETVRVFANVEDAERAKENCLMLLKVRPEIKRANERALQQFLAKWSVDLDNTLMEDTDSEE